MVNFVLLFQQVLPALVPAFPNPVPSGQPYNHSSYKLSLLPPLAGKIRVYLRGATRPAPALPHTSTIPRTPLRPGASIIMAAARAPGAKPKTFGVTFCQQWYLHIRYEHVVGATRLTSIWFELAASAQDGFYPTL